MTADNPLTDYLLIDNMINYFSKNSYLDYLTNNHYNIPSKRKIAVGLDISLFSLKSLLLVKKLAKNNKAFLEYPTLYYYTKGKKKFKIKNLNQSKNLIINNKFRLTVDTINDLKFFRMLFKEYFKKYRKDEYIYLSKVKKILITKRYLKKINENITQFNPL